MKQLKLFSSFLVLIFILSSCSLEKKIYSSGFHVEWNGNSRKSETEIKKDKLVSITKNQIRETKFDSKKISPITKLPQKNYSINFQKAKTVWRKKMTNLFCENKKDTTHSKSAKLHPQKNGDTAPKEKISHFAAIAFTLFMLALILFLLSGSITVFFGIAIELFAIYISILGFREINSDPEKYKGKGLLICGILLGPFVLLLLAVLFVLWFFGYIHLPF